MILTTERLKYLMRYDPHTGLFIRLIANSSRSRIGEIAGSIKSDGRIIIRVDYKMYKAHRLAWFYMTGAWPADQIDHIDGDPLNNRWGNLRLATNSENHCNKLSPLNTSGYKGVRFEGRWNLWRAEIKRFGKVHWLGYFGSAEAAFAAYCAAAEIHHGEFARVN